MDIRGLTLGFCAILCMAESGAARAQTEQAPSVADTIAASRKVLSEQYVLPDVAARLDQALAAAESRGSFRGLSGDALAGQVNAVMREVTRDGHLRMAYQPRLAALLASNQEYSQPASAFSDAVARQLKQTNAGVTKLELLPGNIRYLAYDNFAWGTPTAQQAIATAMQFLREGDAIIVDLRNNPGGSAEAEAAMVSYFVAPGTKLVRFEMRNGMAAKTSETSATPFTLAGKPTYVLIGPATVSGAEGFAAHAATLHFGTLVGQNTGGASYTMRLFPLPGGFTLSVSIGRSINAVTGADWEGAGIAPAIAAPAGNALEIAEAAAMEKIVAGMGEADRAQGARLLEFYRAQAHPVTPALPLSAYVGHYGDYTVALARERLTVAWANFLPIELIAVGPSAFAPLGEPTIRIRFITEAGAVTAWEFDAGGAPQRATRRPES